MPIPVLSLVASALAADVRFVAVGDTQAVSGDSVNFDVVPTLVEDMNARDPDFAFFVGDLTNGAGSLDRQIEVWNEWRDATSALTSPRYATAGNHDFYPGPGVKAAWADTFPDLPRANSPAGEEGLTYWFDVGDSRFISVLSDDDYGVNVAPDLTWLESVLASSTDKAHVFVFTHHPVSWSTYDTAMGGTQGDFWQLLLQYEVDALITGHWHIYQPGQLGGGEMAGGHSGSAETWEIIGGVGGGYQGYAPVRPSNLGYGFLEIEIDGDRVTASYLRDDDGDGHYDDVADSFELTYARTRARGLVAWYPFDGDLDDHAPAGLGYAIPGTPLGDAALGSDGDRGEVLALDGDGDAMEASAIHSYHHSLKGDLAISVYARADARGGDAWDNALVAYATNDEYTEDEETNYAYWLSVEPDGTLRAFWEYGDGENVVARSTATAPTDLAWHQYGLTRDVATRSVRFYVDGAPLGDAVRFDRLPSGASRGYLYVGADTVDNAASFWGGAIDEVCLFDRVLSDAEMATVYAEGGCASFAVGDPGTGGETGGETGDNPDGKAGGETEKGDEGCGCASSGHGDGAWLALGAAAVGLRRRRSITS